MSLSTTAATDVAPRPKKVRRRGWRYGFKIAAVFFGTLFVVGASAAMFLQSLWGGQHNLFSILGALGGTVTTLVDPRTAFPGQSKITVLCLGLDRNILTSRDPKLNGMPYTKGARSDVMMIATLDLVNQSATIVSVPRDTRIQYPTKRYAKINEAHARGGIPYTREIVQGYLGIPLDYHVVIKQEAIQGMVDALGGLKVRVEKDMDYDDNWGQLHIHLKAGEQVLNGAQVVGYMRYRHDNEGDFGRIRRQQQVIQTLSERAKDPSVITKAAPVIGAIRKFVQTDLSPNQQLALASLFHKVSLANIQTASLPVLDTAKINGVDYVIPDDDKKEALVDWLVNGNKDAMNRIIRVEVRNAGADSKLFEDVYDCLRHYGFDVRRSWRSRGSSTLGTRVVQCSKLRGAARRVREVLGLPGDVQQQEMKTTDVVLYVGKEVAASATVASRETWPEAPVRKYRPDYLASADDSRPRRRRAVAKRGLDVEVQPAAAESEPEPEPGTTEEPALDVPGTADPERHSTPERKGSPEADPAASSPEPKPASPAGSAGAPPTAAAATDCAPPTGEGSS